MDSDWEDHENHGQPAQMFKQEGRDVSRCVSRRILQLKVEDEVDGARAEVEAASGTGGTTEGACMRVGQWGW